jgi:hypothetical protein
VGVSELLAAAWGVSREGEAQMTLDKFVEEVRNGLCIMGLPLNGGWQPSRSEIAGWYYMRFTISEVVLRYKARVESYETFVNKGTKYD